jgi:hypothetical protein
MLLSNLSLCDDHGSLTKAGYNVRLCMVALAAGVHTRSVAGWLESSLTGLRCKLLGLDRGKDAVRRSGHGVESRHDCVQQVLFLR